MEADLLQGGQQSVRASFCLPWYVHRLHHCADFLAKENQVKSIFGAEAYQWFRYQYDRKFGVNSSLFDRSGFTLGEEFGESQVGKAMAYLLRRYHTVQRHHLQVFPFPMGFDTAFCSSDTTMEHIRVFETAHDVAFRSEYWELHQCDFLPLISVREPECREAGGIGQEVRSSSWEQICGDVCATPEVESVFAGENFFRVQVQEPSAVPQRNFVQYTEWRICELECSEIEVYLFGKGLVTS